MAARDPAPQPSPARRSARAHRAVLAAATDLLAEGGYPRLTVDAIAARAGVSKATIYRWWPNKAAIVMEGFLRLVEPDIAFGGSGPALAAVRAQVAALTELLDRRREGAMLRSLIAEAQHDPELAEAIRREWIEPRRQAARSVLAQGVATGELRPDLDLEAALDVLYGPLYFRMLLGHAPLGEDAVAELVDTAARGLASR